MDRCNFRCPYCMPKEQVSRPLPVPEIAGAAVLRGDPAPARLFAALGVRKLRLTGGEPLLRANLADLVGDLTAIPGIEDIALTTNGVLLAQHAVDLHANGLQARHREPGHARRGRVQAHERRLRGTLDQVLHGIEAAIAAGLAPVKINAVIERGVNDHTALDLVERFRGTCRSSCASSSSWTSATATTGAPSMVVPSRELAARIAARWPMHPVSENYRGEVAQRWRFDDGERRDRLHLLGLAALLRHLQPRAPLLRGQVLHLPVRHRRPRPARQLRSGATDEDLQELIRGAWHRRADRYSELRDELRREHVRTRRKIEMYYIGG